MLVLHRRGEAHDSCVTGAVLDPRDTFCGCAVVSCRVRNSLITLSTSFDLRMQHSGS